MWLLPSCPSAPGSAGSNWPSVSPGPNHEWWLTLSGKPTRRPSSWRGWKTRPWHRLLFGAETSQTWTPRCSAVSGWSPPASHVSRGAAQARAEGLTTSGGSGLTSLGSFATWDPDSSAWKTSRASLFEAGWEPYSGTWPRWGSMRSGACSRRPPLAPRTSGSGSTSWPTPDASAAQDGELVRRAALKAAKMWQTPTAQDSDHGAGNEGREGGLNLLTQASSWPTPTAHDAQGTGPSQRSRNSLTLQEAASSLPDPTTSTPGPKSSEPTRRLNPRFVGWLMGLPVGWTDTTTRLAGTNFERWEMESCRWLGHWLSVYSQSGRAPAMGVWSQ